VATAPTATTFTLTGVDITTGGTAVGVLTRTYTAAFAATDGDYFHRTVSWYTSQGDDAPNGHPGTNPVAAPGEVAFETQMAAWCSACHTRYWANQNPNPTGTTPGSSPFTVKNLGTIDTVTDFITTLSVTSGSPTSPGLAVGDVVLIAGRSGSTPDINSSWTVVDVSGNTFKIGPDRNTPLDITAAGSGGNVDRTSAPQTASTWYFPRPGESVFKFQHRTVSNRVCTTCHVSHGSNAVMDSDPGTPGAQGFSGNFTRPNGVASSSSRLLKIDNRGVCQGCHDPTSTIPAGSYTGLPQRTP
jgi:hypothetical protein